MKTTAFFLVSMMMSALTFGQTNPQFQPKEAQTSISIHDYLRDHMNCPRENPGGFIPGTEVIAFVVTSTGELTDFRVVSSVSIHIDEDMIRVLKETSGSWLPGQINGESVAMEKEVSLAFMPYYYDPVSEAKKYLAKGNSVLYKNPKRALRFINEAYRLFPCDESVLVARSQCKYELGDVEGAVQDCNRIIALNSVDDIQHEVSDPNELLEQLLGYDE